MEDFNWKKIEAKWQGYWQKNQVFKTPEENNKNQKKYILDMFPYPSGDGLHVGHVKIYTASDVIARYWRLKGYAVLHPTGWDAFGLPTENSAIKFKVHPAELTRRNTDRFRKQMQALGFSYDWEREINTTDPNYYKWTQWIFLQLFKQGLAYQATVPINWCPSCKTGLANEEVVNGHCERCGTLVELKPMKQWMMRITNYAEKLLEGLEGLEWPTSILDMQRNWIGKSEGAQIKFKVISEKFKKHEEIEVFTTRPDTLFGATYLVVAPEHPILEFSNKKEVLEYVKRSAKKTDLDRQDEKKEKTGVELKGIKAINPANGEEIPVWVADYVLMNYGTGAIMAVPAHDERDFEFAKKYELPIRKVIQRSVGDENDEELKRAFTGVGVLINSDKFSGQDNESAKAMITKYVHGEKRVNYHLRDWVFSRQHYWGEPIPIVHCEKCGAVPVPEKDLPVTLPPVKEYQPTGTGESPLSAVKEWVETKCPKCQGNARRETDTMPNWAGSSWYFLRFTDPRNENEFAGQEQMKNWMPVDMYIGGAEHAVLHLLYARFWQKALKDAGLVQEDEPFKKFFGVGLVMGEDGQKMSKSRGNVVNPDDVVNEYGADALRIYEMFMGPFEASVAWDTSAIAGAQRFLKRVGEQFSRRVKMVAGQDSPKIEISRQRTIKRVTESIEKFKFNTAVAALMELLNEMEAEESVSAELLEIFIILLSPLAPHLAEELWQQLGKKQSIWEGAKWPIVDQEVLASAKVTYAIQVNGKVRGTITIEPKTEEFEVKKKAQELPNVSRYLEGAKIKKVIYVPGKLVNFVVSQD